MDLNEIAWRIGFFIGYYGPQIIIVGLLLAGFVWLFGGKYNA